MSTSATGPEPAAASAPAVIPNPAVFPDPDFRADSDGADEITAVHAADADTAGTVEAAGHFRIYLGAAAGVGKTYAMLSEARRRKERGTDIVVAFVETHGRPHTEAMIEGLEVIPRKRVPYRDSVLEEMDLEAVLRRDPKVALVDELAHTNVPGSGRNAKRWQDVNELLAAGIDVITTVNIQHLESIADEVENMTGAKVRERVPDWVVRKADQIELVDSSPEQLRRRMLHGNIYPTKKVSQALSNFFRTDNLIALRELALRFLADETEDELLEHLRRHEATGVWETCERLMVAVTGAPGTDALLRRAARMATRLKGDLDVVHVTATDGASTTDKEVVEKLTKLTDDIGARWYDLKDDDAARAIAEFARANQITQIVIGSSQRSRWQQLTGGGSNVTRVIREAGPLGIDVHVIALHKPSKSTLARAKQAARNEAVPSRAPRSLQAREDGQTKKTEKTHMQYALLIYSQPDALATPDEPEWAELNKEYWAIREVPGVSTGAALQPVKTATTIRLQDGKTLVTDGPFADTKEVLAGFYLYEADNLDQATEIAARIPAVRLGGSVEIRPVMVY